MQFNRDASGKFNPLPKPSVDTGMGLERVAAVLQNKISNFDTDLFTPLIERVADLAGIDVEHELKQPYLYFKTDGETSEALGGRMPSVRIVADHTRAATFLIADGLIPSNEGRGYVLRKIIRRALIHVRHLQGSALSDPLVSKVARSHLSLALVSETVRAQMNDAYPELEEHADRIGRILYEEENRFARTVEVGTATFERLVAEKNLARAGDDELLDGAKEIWGERAQDAVRFIRQKARKEPLLDGLAAFRLYDTYGLPRDFIEDLALDHGVKVDWVGFDRAMEEQQIRSKASWKGAHKEAASPVYRKLADTFTTEPDFYFGTTTQRLPHRSHRHEERPGERTQSRRRRRKSCSTAPPFIPSRADKWRTPADSTTTTCRCKSPKCAARIIPSRD